MQGGPWMSLQTCCQTVTAETSWFDKLGFRQMTEVDRCKHVRPVSLHHQTPSAIRLRPHIFLTLCFLNPILNHERMIQVTVIMRCTYRFSEPSRLDVISINTGWGGGAFNRLPDWPLLDDVNTAQASKGNAIIVSAHKAPALGFGKPQPVTWSKCQYLWEKDEAGTTLQAKGQVTEAFGTVSWYVAALL